MPAADVDPLLAEKIPQHPALPAPARAPLGLPRLDRLVRKPDRQAPPPAQALVVLPPIHDLALLFGDVGGAVLVQFERQGGRPGSGEKPHCYFSRAPGATGRIRATTWLRTQIATMPA